MIGYLLTVYIEKHGLNNRSLSRKLGFSHHTIGHWRNHKHTISFFSAECVLILLLKDVKPENHNQYKEFFWDLYRFDQQLKLSNYGVKNVRLND